MSDQQPPREEDEHEHAGSGPWHDGASAQTRPVWQDAEDMETAERAPAGEPDESEG